MITDKSKQCSGFVHILKKRVFITPLRDVNRLLRDPATVAWIMLGSVEESHEISC